jgi:hypothetical protein
LTRPFYRTGHPLRLPPDWRARLPDPREYFASRLKLAAPSASDNASTACPFHTDRVASFSVALARGLWRCHAGCDLTVQ